MQCPKCELTIKPQSRFCNHCGTKIELNNTNDIEHVDEQIHNQSHIHAASSEQQQIKTSDKKSLVFALLIGIGSSLVVWIISLLLSLTKQQVILSRIWEFSASQLLNLPLAKTILIEQQVNTSIWYITNQFIGGYADAKYTIGNTLHGSFTIHFPIMLFIFIMIALAFTSQKIISAFIRKQQNDATRWTKLLASIIYSLAAWIVIALPLFIFSPQYRLPFSEATETLQLQLSFVPSFLHGLAIIVTGICLAWVPIKQFKLPAIMTLLLTLLLFARDIGLSLLKSTSASSTKQLFSNVNAAGLDSLWLNRFISEVLSMFGSKQFEHVSLFDQLYFAQPLLFNSTAIIMWLGLVCVTLSLAALSWKAYSKFSALVIGLIGFSYYFTTLSITQTASLASDTYVQQLKAYQYNDNVITSFVIPLLFALAILILIKLLHDKSIAKVLPTSNTLNHFWTHRAKYLSALLLLVFIANSSFMLINHHSPKNDAVIKQIDEQQYASDWAKQLYIMQQGPREYALIHAQELWAQQGTPESKALLALSYLQSYQHDRGQALLKESLSSKNKLFTKEELASLIDLTDLSEPLSAINQTSLVASTTATGTDENWHATMDLLIAPKINELLVQIENTRLPKLIKTNIEELHQQVKLDPAYIDFIKVVDKEKIGLVQAAYAEATQLINEQINSVEQHVAEQINAVADDEQQDETIQSKKAEAWQDFVSKQLAQLLTLAKSAIYYDDLKQAELLLSLVVTTQPDYAEAAILLSSLYLNGLEPSSSIIKDSVQYESVTFAASDIVKEKLAAALKDYVISTEEHLTKTIENSYITEHTSEQLAYEILKPFTETALPEVDYQLAKYYFHTNQDALATEQIERLNDRVEELEASQQQVIQQLKAMPQKTSDMTITEMQLRHELTEQLYHEMDPMRGKSFHNRELSSEEQAFSVYLSHTLLSFNKSALQATSIQYVDGTVTLYLQSDNVALLKDKLTITDNEYEISQFELTKLGESSSFERYVMLILDRSGSMQGEKIEAAKQSAIDFVHNLQYGEHVGVVTFNDSSALDLPFTPSLTKITDVLASIEAEDGTRIAPALNLGIDKLQYEKGERIAFILSDGEDSEFSDPTIRQSIIHEANRAGITIYAVGFDAGYQTLRDVAEGTGGYYIGATDFESLSQGFEKISETLSQTYQVKYKVDAADYGLHIVTIKQDEFADKKDYTIFDPNAVEDTTLDNRNDVGELLDDTFNISSFTPNKILVSNSGSTLITVEGTKLKDVTSVAFRDNEIDFKAHSDTKLSFTVSNKQPKGKLKVSFKTKTNEEKSITLTFTDSKAQQSIPFGYATLYGDKIDTKNGEVEISGNPSIDHFIYPHSNVMMLDTDEVLSYTGLDLYTNKVMQTVFDAKMEMSMTDFGKLFDIESQGLYSKTMNSLPGLDRFGISMRLARALEYEANIRNDNGTLKLSGGMQGFDKLNQLNQNLKFKVNTSKGLLEFLPTNATIEQEYTKDDYTLNADFGLNIAMPMLKFDSVDAGFKYESPDKRVVIKGKVSGFELFRMQTSGNSLGSVGLEVGYHFANGLDRLAADLETNIPIPLATSGLGINQLGLVADWSNKNEGALTLGLTTMSDAALNRLVNAVNSIPVVNKIFSIDPNICLVCLSGTLGFNELGSKDWSLNGKIGAELLGLQLSEASAKATRNDIEVKTSESIVVVSLDQTQAIVFKDPRFNNYTTLKYSAEIDPIGLNPHTFVTVLVPQRVSASYLELSKEKKGKTITIHRVGNKLNMIKS